MGTSFAEVVWMLLGLTISVAENRARAARSRAGGIRIVAACWDFITLQFVVLELLGWFDDVWHTEGVDFVAGLHDFLFEIKKILWRSRVALFFG